MQCDAPEFNKTAKYDSIHRSIYIVSVTDIHIPTTKELLLSQFLLTSVNNILNKNV